jgi:hypothetical protein
VRTELLPLLVIPFLAHHPEQLHSQSAGHGDFRNLPSETSAGLTSTMRSIVCAFTIGRVPFGLGLPLEIKRHQPISDLTRLRFGIVW